MVFNIITGHELDFLIKLIICLIGGLLIGIERESKGKSAGVSTHTLVIGGAMIFTFLSLFIDPEEPARIAAQIVTGIGFLGAGIILKEKTGEVVNLTTAASIWFSAAIGMLIGFGWYFTAAIAIIFSALVPRIPHIWYKKDRNAKIISRRAIG
jgi:putative Mg2+ transporter-C (MgtC) family protein